MDGSVTDHVRKGTGSREGKGMEGIPIQDQVDNLTGGARADGAFGIGRDL